MSKKSDARTALIEARVVREREWMHARWMERMTFRQISAAAALPTKKGGLGITVSTAGVKAMVHAYREDQGDVTMGRDERRERMSDEIDMRVRAARMDLEAAYAGYAKAEAELFALDEYADPSLRVALAKTLEMWQGIIDRADRRLDAAQQREEKLHGLAAPTEIKAEIVHRDAIIDELNAELIALDEKPVDA